ncbi:response regulator [Formosa sp. S-31]|uniref:response regulator n=1 Tax=Formosa sp. S-31 TaxID=2790949 RepID=UPI003EC0C3CC
MKEVLLIEDDAVLRANTAELLELSDYKVITAANGKTGVPLARTELPDIIICDIMMPEMDGYETLQILSQDPSTRHIPFIFLSAKTEHSDIRKGMNLGADDYITKPFTEDELISAIESRLAKMSILEDLQNNQYNAQLAVSQSKLQSMDDLKAYFKDSGKLFSYQEDEIIYREGDHSNYIYLITEGTVKCFRIDNHGKELITGVYKTNSLFGYTSFTHNIPHKETATAISYTKILAVSIQEFGTLLNNNPKLSLDLIELLTDDLSLIKDQLLQMAYGSVYKKTASTIVKFAEKINKKPDDLIKISRNDLASVAGIATETFIRALTEFKKQGLIKAEGRNIQVLNLEGLKAIN